MAATDRAVDALSLRLTGGATNTNPDASLGGLISSCRVRGLGAIITSPIAGARVDNVHPACGEGDAVLAVDTNGSLIFTPPGGVAGTPVPIAEGESKIVTGSDTNKAIRVYREPGLTWKPIVGGMTLVDVLNGVLGQRSVTNAQRLAGASSYRALMLLCPGLYGVKNVRLWLPPVGGSQAVFSLAVETPTGNEVQTIPDETTAPTGVTWSTPTSEGTALVIPYVSVMGPVGLWIRRVFPVGYEAPLENFQLAMKFLGA